MTLRTLAPLIAGALVTFGLAAASPAAILTESFETDGGSDGAGRYLTTDEHFDAQGAGSDSGDETYFIETSDADAGVSDIPATDPLDPAPDGSHYFAASATDDASGTSVNDPATLTFANLGPVINGQLTVALAAGEGGWEAPTATGGDLFEIVADVDGDGTYETTLQLTDVAGGNLEVSDKNASDVALTTAWADFTFVIPDAGSVSDDLAIQFRHHSTSLSAGDEYLGIDNVRVTGDLIPEPTALALLGLGGIAVLGRRNRRDR